LTIIRIDPAKDRYKNNSKSLLEAACSTIEMQDGEIAGYFMMAWDDKGGTSFRARSGGPISLDLLPTHIMTTAGRVK